MSTFLELCQSLRQETGISGTGPASVKNQTGEMQRIVTWINRAYRYVITKHAAWNFMRPTFAFQTIAGTDSYLPSAVNVTDHGSWKTDSLRCYLTSAGTADEQWLTYVPWERFRDLYQFGGTRTTPGRPQWVSVKPDQSLVFHPVPDAEYTITGERFRKPTPMVENADIPVLPEEFHDIIMWRAKMFYGTYENAPEQFAEGRAEYRRMLNELERKELPEFDMAGPLA